MRYFLLIIILFVTSETFSQLLNFSTPEKLNGNINSNFEEMNPLLSSDGSKLYFVRAFDPSNRGGELAGTDIWVSERDSLGEWGIATNKLDSWNNRSNNAVVGIGSNNDIVYLLNSYKSGKSGIAFSKRSIEGWTPPEVIKIPGINRNDFVGYYMNPDFDILLISMNRSDSYGQEDIYVSVKDSLQNWSKPINLGPTINTSGFEISPFLSDDGKKLYFSSNGHPGLGDADIFVSERLYNSWDVWGAPKNLGNKINSSSFDAYFLISGSASFLISNRDGGMSDIFTSNIVFRTKTVLKDSIDKILKETKELLSDLRVQKKENPFVAEVTLLLDFKPSVLAQEPKNQIRQLLLNYELNSIAKVEILAIAVNEGDRINGDRAIKVVGDYLRLLGISQGKLETRIEVNSEYKSSRVEIKFFQ